MKINLKRLLITLSTMAALAGPALAQSVGDRETGLASVYATRLDEKVTASGQTYDRTKLTAAHKTLPFGTKVRVTNKRTHRSVTVRINDRGPAPANRILDISPAAAARLGMQRNTMREVSYSIVSIGDGKVYDRRRHDR